MDKAPTLRVLYTVGVLAGSLALLGCPKRPELVQAASAIGPATGTAPAAAAAKPAPRAPEVPVTREMPPAEMPVRPAPAVASPAASALKDIFFNFDDAMIRDHQKAALESDFQWLKAHPDVKIKVEGNCDERGTAEYNLALGERRAETVKASLVAEGIAAGRISTISYGKERPFVLGHDENAWKWNRRDHVVVAQ
jgi:peptidoglycan-associated lipoprotein